MFARPMAVASLSALLLLACSGSAQLPVTAPAAPAAAAEATPPGIDQGVWRDVAWLPAGLTSIAGFPHAHAFGPVLDWLVGMELAKGLPCVVEVTHKVDRYLMVEGPAVKADVFFGSAGLDEVRVCAEKFLAGLGGRAEVQGELVALSDGQRPPAAYLGATRHGNEIMIVQSRDAAVVRALLAQPGGLAHDARLLHLLEGLDLGGDAWAAGLIDYGSKPLGIPSIGYQSSVSISGVKQAHGDARADLRLHFASPDEATRAESAGRALFDAKVAEPDHGVIARALEVSTKGPVLNIHLHASEADLKPTLQALMNVAAWVTGADPIDLSAPAAGSGR